MDSPIEILVAVFKDPSRANAMVNTLKQMHKGGAVRLIDCATVTHDDKGKPKINEITELTTVKGGERGAIVGGVLGLIFPPSILAGAAVGAVAGGLWGKLRDTGIKTDELRTVADELAPGEIAVVAVVEDTWVQQLLVAAQGYDRLVRQALDAEAAGILMADPVTGDAVAVGFERSTGDASTGSATPPTAPAAPASGAAETETTSSQSASS
jgi:uncharacterized membrane protein